MTAGTMFGIWLGELISEFGIRNQGLSLDHLCRYRVPNPREPADDPGGCFDPHDHDRLPGDLPDRHHLRHRGCPARAAECAGDVSWPAGRAGHVDARQRHLASHGQHGGHDPVDLCPIHPDLPGCSGRLLARLKRAGWVAIAEVINSTFGGQSNTYWILYFLSVVLFSFFYTDVLFSQQNYGENLKKVGAQIPGVSRGVPTQKYLTRVLRRITFPGALFLGLVAIMPFILTLVMSAFGTGIGFSCIGFALGLFIRLADRGRCGARYFLQHRRRAQAARL